MNVYRINLRFDLDDERERMAAEYLQQFPQRGKTTRNRFAVDALCAYISRIEQDDTPRNGDQLPAREQRTAQT